MEFIYITNEERLALNAQDAGIDRIMVDLEILGKVERQGHLSSVISRHSIDDVKKIKNIINKSKLLVRVNPINENSENEINKVIEYGAEIVMLPMFKTSTEVKQFISYVNKRAKVCLLLETSQALVRLDEILLIEGIDEIHVGLNDLHLGMGLEFMFELLSGGIVEYISKKVRDKGIIFGFGGVGRLKEGLPLDPKLILSEHVRLGSEMVILSRDFKDYCNNCDEIQKKIDLKEEVLKLRDYINSIKGKSELLLKNQKLLKEKVNVILSEK